MKGKPEVLEVLQKALKEEVSAAIQYILHGEMCENWGYKALAGITKKRAIEEMKHAEKLIERVLFLEGIPAVEPLPRIEAGKDVEQQFRIDLKGEIEAISSYNEGIAICHKAGDQSSGELLRHNLQDEERHTDFLETQLSLIKEVGLANYLARKLEEV